MEAIQRLPGELLGELSLVIQCSAESELPEEFWKELEKKKLHSLMVWKNEYVFSINDYRSIANLQVISIANIFPETPEEQKILRSGKPRKIYDPLIRDNIYTLEEIEYCNIQRNSLECFLSLPDLP